MTQNQTNLITRKRQPPTVAASAEGRSMVDSRPTQIEALISARAYAFYVARGYESGFALDDWLRAEAEVMRQRINQLPM